MTFRTTRTSLPYRLSALLVLSGALFVHGAAAQTRAASAAPDSPYGGDTVEDIVARVNDQIISHSDYDRAMKEMDDEARQRGESMQQISDGHKELLRNLIDQQLWISKGKELDITGETELVKQLDSIRKRYNLATMEDLEKAAQEQGVSFEDFKANIRNQIVTQEVMRQEVGKRVTMTPGEAERYFAAHKDDYAQQESVRLSEILVSTGTPAPSATVPGVQPDDPEKLATAKAKADDIEAKIKAGTDFDQLARTQSEGPTATEGGDLGKFTRGSLAKALEDATFGLKAGQVTEPIRTKQGYVILKVTEHVAGGVPAYKDVEPQVEEALYNSRMEPAMRDYLTEMREEAYIDIKPGYEDSGASPKETKPVYSAYAPPAPKKKKKAVRTRFRETEHGFRDKTVPVNTASTPAATPAAGSPAVETAASTTAAAPATAAKTKTVASAATPSTMKAGKKEKIRFGQAPRETLPNSAQTKVEDAGALPSEADNSANEPADNPLQPTAVEKKTRFSERARLPKAAKPKGPQLDPYSPAAPAADEVADQQSQSSPLGLAGDTAKKKKKASATATTGQKTRIEDRPKSTDVKQAPEITVPAPVPGAPAPAGVSGQPSATTPPSTTSEPEGASPPAQN